jgi:hypothetical protein
MVYVLKYVPTSHNRSIFSKVFLGLCVLVVSTVEPVNSILPSVVSIRWIIHLCLHFSILLCTDFIFFNVSFLILSSIFTIV